MPIKGSSGISGEGRVEVASVAPIIATESTESTDPRPTPGLWFPSPNLLQNFFLRVGDSIVGGRGTQIQGGAGVPWVPWLIWGRVGWLLVDRGR